MIQTKVRWAILGTSYISEVMAKAIQASASSELVAIGSRSFQTAEAFANKYSIRKRYTDYQELLNDQEIDAIYIGLPNHLHKEWMMRAAKSKKHILCEKPFVTSVDDAREVMSVIEENNVFCLEALMYRCHPFIHQLKGVVDSKMIGDIKLFNATYTAHIIDVANPTAGGAIRNLGCYPISLIRLLAKAEPVEIVGRGRMSDDDHNDNQASAILTFENNVMAVVSTADDIKMTWQFDVYGTKGHIKLITNPWMPSQEHNQFNVYLNDEESPIEIKMKADKPLYTYQIDFCNSHIQKNNSIKYERKILQDSVANTIVLEAWREQVKKCATNSLDNRVEIAI